ncbi:MAG: ABC transporter ATP-binding protein, partial [Deltaproteobacteria bacterium]|nr:ABC transporter ATP-binding protein [Deltaproteobacteria bacterium]
DIHRKIARTMIYVTHDQAEALSMADRIAVMRKGRVVQVGTPRELYTNPVSAFVAEFIGGTNLFPGKLEERGQLLTVKLQDGVLQAVNGAGGLGRGDPVICSIRPEAIHLHVEGAPRGSTPGQMINRLTGEVQSITYLGDSEQYSLSLADGTLVRAVEHNPKSRKAEVGDRVSLEIDVDDVVVLPQEPSSE